MSNRWDNKLIEEEKEYREKYAKALENVDDERLIRYFEELVRCGASRKHYRLIILRKEMIRRMTCQKKRQED